jgi:hypothetical protein
MSFYSLATVRERLWKYAQDASGVPYASATVAQKAAADFRINQVSERIFGSGKWRFTLRRVTIDIHDEYVTLPRELGTILGIKLMTSEGRCCNSQIYSRFHEFAHSYTGCCSTGSYPMSETAQTFITPTGPFKLRVKSTVTAGNITFLRGWSEDDAEYFDSVSLAITDGTTTTTREWNGMPQIQKEITTVGVELYSVDSDGNEELIAVYGPREEIPTYKRYKVPNCTSLFTTALVLGKLAYVEAVADSDVVIPSNWGALKMGLKALKSEDTEEDQKAQREWGEVYNLLNSELEEADGDNEFPVFKMSPGTGCENVRNLV